MTKEIIILAQEYLRVRTPYGCKRIADIAHLFERLSVKEVIEVLKENLRKKEKELKNMILIDKTHEQVDRLVASMFRINMAIRTLEEAKYAKEVIKIERSQSGAEESGQLYQRDSGGHCRAGIGQDQNHDGKNRFSGNQSKRAA